MTTKTTTTEASGGGDDRHVHPGLPRDRVRLHRGEGGPPGRARAVDAPAHGARRVRDGGVRRGDPADLDGVLGLASGVTDAPRILIVRLTSLGDVVWALP